MTTELTLLAWTLVLALVHIFASVIVRTRQHGSKWNAGPRDEAVAPPSVVAGRLVRAQANLFETLPIFIGLVLIAHVAGIHSATTVLACQLFLGARIVYLPLYALGVPVVRTLAFLVALAGLVMLFRAVL